MMNKKETIEMIMDKYQWVKYKHHGRIYPNLDCYGLIICIYKDIFNIKLFDIEEDYDINFSWKGRNYFVENYYRQWELVKKPDFLDVVLFKNNKGIANHGGVYLKDDKFINCGKAGCFIDSLESLTWKKRLFGFFHLKERDINDSCKINS